MEGTYLQCSEITAAVPFSSVAFPENFRRTRHFLANCHQLGITSFGALLCTIFTAATRFDFMLRPQLAMMRDVAFLSQPPDIYSSAGVSCLIIHITAISSLYHHPHYSPVIQLSCQASCERSLLQGNESDFRLRLLSRSGSLPFSVSLHSELLI